MDNHGVRGLSVPRECADRTRAVGCFFPAALVGCGCRLRQRWAAARGMHGVVRRFICLSSNVPTEVLGE